MVFRSPTSGVIETGPARAPRELDRVRLREAVRDGAVEFPAGSEGTVVHCYKGGADFEVEFAAPVAAVLTIEAAKLQLITPAPRKRKSA